jgi:hypothetical protein
MPLGDFADFGPAVGDSQDAKALTGKVVKFHKLWNSPITSILYHFLGAMLFFDYNGRMKITSLALAASTLLAGPGHALAADPGSCYGIGDADARTYCLAKARNDANMCYAIQRAELRSACLSEVRK